MIQVIYGSIFDTKCDLLIVPCDSAGGVTGSVYSNLQNQGLPTKIGRIPYGSVYFRESKYAFSSIIGYAASVDVETIKSDSDTIKQIAEVVIRYSVENKIGIVNIPLLGSGAGGMTPVDSYKSLQSVFDRQDDLTFNVFCFTKESYLNTLAAAETTPEEQPLKHPRVFISYTGTNKDNASWVKELAEALLRNGVDARLDVFHLKPGYDMPQWMTNEVIMADKVLLVCDGFYMEKADFRKGGVGWETMIIQGDMLAQGSNMQKYIAIIREDKVDKALPIYLKSKYAFNWGKSPDIDSEHLRELILCIFECDSAPEIGSIPDYVKRKIGRSRITVQQNQTNKPSPMENPKKTTQNNIDDLLIDVPNISRMENANKMAQSSIEELLKDSPNIHSIKQKYILLFGPPGTGKTTFAFALSNKYKLPLKTLTTREVASKFVDGRALAISEFFTQARKSSKSIILLDEVDQLAMSSNAENAEMEKGTNMLKDELSGTHSDTNNFYLIACTNQPWRIDTAFLSRFGGLYYMGLLDRDERISILRDELGSRGITLADSDIEDIASQVVWATGSDILHIVSRYEFSLEPDALSKGNPFSKELLLEAVKHQPRSSKLVNLYKIRTWCNESNVPESEKVKLERDISVLER